MIILIIIAYTLIGLFTFACLSADVLRDSDSGDLAFFLGLALLAGACWPLVAIATLFYTMTKVARGEMQ